MKNVIISTIAGTLLFFNANAQIELNFAIDFNSPIADPNIVYYIDTVHNPNNMWQIGYSNKTYLQPPITKKVLITDTMNPYPINDTSYFVIKIWDHGLLNVNGIHDFFSAQFYYKADPDTLKDFGFLEFSPNNGQSWYFMNNIIYIPCWWGSGDDWVAFSGHNGINWGGLNLMDFGIFCINNLPNIQDTVQLRFGFISDSIFDNKEGLMINFIGISVHTGVGIQEINNAIFSISPNPFTQSTQITLSQTYHSIALAVYDIQGKQVAQQHYADCDKIQFSRNQLSNGLYFLKLTLDDKEVETGKIVISE